MATITGYGIGLFIHILAVVIAAGPTFSYGIFVSTASRYPQAVPAVLTGIMKTDRYLVNPGMIVLLLAGIYLLSDGPWDASANFISVGFVAIIALFGLLHGFFMPQSRKALALAERDLKAGDTLSDEFNELSERIGKVGMLAGLIVVVATFFMAVKP